MASTRWGLSLMPLCGPKPSEPPSGFRQGQGRELLDPTAEPFVLFPEVSDLLLEMFNELPEGIRRLPDTSLPFVLLFSFDAIRDSVHCLFYRVPVCPVILDSP